ncbi:hypothetical protein M1B34_21620 [Pseudomonas sp. MAFF 302030]|uniref:Uncharacterized protein n=1 Tax=Pseudomonas morbosilactucae TaxID=2938197 RepID=A0A9X1Z048_9PSED|nr:hypothetical protein [Pseudomonas morbosilactucae]MCK9800222.1 hypothetical protein [Pseudomonas morbosilactucae]MCK9813903.1 hypothetical protein [Pseudomonas morbosilactucae]
MNEWIVKDSPRSGQAAEADFGELQYLNVARLKAGAHYTGITQKREFFLSEKSAERLCGTGFAQRPAKVYFAKARPCWSSSLNGSPSSLEPSVRTLSATRGNAP